MGAIIGAGIFVITGIAAASAGSAFIVSTCLAAVVALLSALSFAELMAWRPPWAPQGSVPVIAAAVCLMFTALNAWGMRQSTGVNNALVAVKLAILVFFCPGRGAGSMP